MTAWPERPQRAGNNPVVWNTMSVIWQGDEEPTGDVRDGDHWRTSDREFVRRNGAWERAQ